jgi:hypothetical protein
MSSNAPQSTQNNQTRPFKKQRTHRIIRRFKRGRDGKIYFDGMQPGEEVRRIVRKHIIFSARATIPFFLSVVLTLLIFWANSSTPSLFAGAWHLLEILCALAIIGTGLYAAYRIFELWWVDVDVVTNRRILTWRGLRSPTRKETTHDKISQVGVDQRSLLAILLNYGDVKVYVTGGKDLDLLKVAKPKEVRDDIEGITQSYKASRPKKAPLPPVLDPQLSGVLAKLAKPEELPHLPDADEKYAHRRDPRKLRGPLRTFGGPLRIPCDVHYGAEEYTVKYVQRSKIVLFYRLILPFLILLAFLILSLTLIHNFLPFVIGFFVVAIWIVLRIINYIDDVFILTNMRIIDIHRKYFFLYEEHDTTTYDKISEITVTAPNPIELAFDIGNLDIITPGNNPDIHMNRIPDPFGLQDFIYYIKDFKEKVGKAKTKNEQKELLNDWFTNVLSTLETKINNRGVPDLQSKDLWEAMDQASELGMRVIPIGESSQYPNIPPGKIVSQIPPPGTLVSMNGTDPNDRPQIQVIVSKASA